MAKVKAIQVEKATQILMVLHNRLENEICQALMVENTRLAERLNHHLVEAKKAETLLKAAS